MSENDCVTLEVRAGVATITIRRESSLNALNTAVLEGISDRVRQLAVAVEPVRVLLFRGAGDRAFVAGADIKLMHSGDRGAVRGFVELGQRVMREIELFAAPVVMVVQGFAFGGGLELALSGDLIIASERARFGQPEVKLGLIPGFGGTQRLSLRVGYGAARRLILTGDDISAAEAYRLGIVDYLSPPENLEQTVDAVCASLVARSPVALAGAKRAIRRLHEESALGGLNFEIEQFLEVYSSPDAKEGLSAFVEKRSPTFTGGAASGMPSLGTPGRGKDA